MLFINLLLYFNGVSSQPVKKKNESFIVLQNFHALNSQFRIILILLSSLFNKYIELFNVANKINRISYTGQILNKLFKNSCFFFHNSKIYIASWKDKRTNVAKVYLANGYQKVEYTIHFLYVIIYIIIYFNTNIRYDLKIFAKRHSSIF